MLKFLGSNVENVSFGLSICAERCAVFKAVSNGTLKLKICFISTDMDYFVTACGACRQVMAEFDNKLVFCVNKDGKMKYFSNKFLLPSSCNIDHLKDGNNSNNNQG